MIIFRLSWPSPDNTVWKNGVLFNSLREQIICSYADFNISDLCSGLWCKYPTVPWWIFNSCVESCRAYQSASGMLSNQPDHNSAASIVSSSFSFNWEIYFLWVVLIMRHETRSHHEIWKTPLEQRWLAHQQEQLLYWFGIQLTMTD